ncbi:MAG: 6-phosphogluconolactonase, partial [Lentisphaeria bacterium]|nr:6-phosphogluconolactonase [Lentisphaeria bacterium]
YNSLSSKTSELIMKQVRANPQLLICTATGGTPSGAYQELSQHSTELFSEARFIKLDEWGGIPMDDPGSCELYLQDKLIKPLAIDKERYYSLNSQTDDAESECRRIQSFLDKNGPIALCILGLGLNGHLGFNEPADELRPFCHVAQLTQTSLSHPMIVNHEIDIRYGLSLGMANILTSQHIFLLVNGEHKIDIFNTLLSQSITTQCPASFLWTHPNVTCILDESVAPATWPDGLEIDYA